MNLSRSYKRIGPLTFLALMFAVSGALRLGQGIGTAMALQADEPENTLSAPVQCPDPPERLAEALNTRDAAVTAREAAMRDRMAALTLAEQSLETRLAELAAAEASLKATLALADGAAENDLTRLTAVYEAMKPAEAAALFETMAPEFASGFLGRMRPESAAAILSGMQPESAYSLSVLIAGRNALAPKD
ncbi:MotE family protein [Pseudotabrizicola sp. L79]|uniref:MotE family protein n=1 Tax=Pseudotabrizicola sp. L79 TaxID=3118402 RepID=UPI002F94FBEE